MSLKRPTAVVQMLIFETLKHQLNDLTNVLHRPVETTT